MTAASRLIADVQTTLGKPKTGHGTDGLGLAPASTLTQMPSRLLFGGLGNLGLILETWT